MSRCFKEMWEYWPLKQGTITQALLLTTEVLLKYPPHKFIKGSFGPKEKVEKNGSSSAGITHEGLDSEWDTKFVDFTLCTCRGYVYKRSYIRKGQRVCISQS